jgi:hypothetical protein
LGKLSGIVVFEPLSWRRSIANRSWRRHARRARSLFAQLCHIFAVAQNDGSDAEAGGRSQRQAEQGDPHVTLS